MVRKKVRVGGGLIAVFVIVSSAAGIAHAETWQALPAAFERNDGQADSAIRFIGRASDYLVEVYSDGSLSWRAGDDSAVRLHWSGGAARPNPVEQNPVGSRINYYRGNDPSQWKPGVHLFQRVAFEAVYPGIDIAYQIVDGSLEYIFEARPGADPHTIRMAFTDGWRASVNSSGELELERDGHLLRHRRPVAYQIVGGQQVLIDVHFWAFGNEAGLRVGEHDASLPLVIDPVVKVSSRLGGIAWDAGYGITSDKDGNVYITGETNSSDFPGSQPGRYNNDVFVTKIKGGVILYTTILASSGNDVGRAIAVDAAGNAYIVGTAGASNFPTTTGAAQTVFRGGQDAFVARLDAAGRVVFASLLGGAGTDVATAVALDASGAIAVAGYTSSADFPITAGSPQQRYAGGAFDAFLLKVDPGGSQLLYSVLLGGSGNDTAAGIAVDRSGYTVIVGTTDSRDLPASGPLQTQPRGNGDAFIASLNPAGSQWSFVTYFGGSGPDQATAVAIGSTGDVYVTGSSYSADFPTSAAARQRALKGGYDAFVVRLSSTGTLIYSTLLGGSDADAGTAIVVDTSGQAWVGGYTLSFDFPVLNPAQSSNHGSFDAFVAELDPTGSVLLFGTYWGGALDDRISALAFSPVGSLLATGQTLSSDFPVVGSGPPGSAGGYNAFLAEFDALDVALMISPGPGMTLGAPQVFSWTPIAGAASYWLDVGSTGGIGDYFAGSTSATGLNVTRLPCDGSTVYVQLWTHVRGNWQPPRQYQYTAPSGCMATLNNPPNGTVFTAATVNFNWTSVAGADAYWLDVGNSVGVGNYFAGATAGTTWVVTGLPCGGQTLYVQLWTHVNGKWQPPRRYTYVAASGCTAALTTPVNGAAFSSGVVAFSWNAVAGADLYWLDVGSTPGVGDYLALATSLTAFTVRGLPCDDRPLHAQLWTHIGESWKGPERYTFRSWSACARLTSPVAGPSLSTTTVQFTWTAGTDVTAYWLDVGTQLGKGNIFGANLGTATSRVVTGIPTSGTPIYVQLWSMIGGTWYVNRYTYAPPG